MAGAGFWPPGRQRRFGGGGRCRVSALSQATTGSATVGLAGSAVGNDSGSGQCMRQWQRQATAVDNGGGFSSRQQRWVTVQASTATGARLQPLSRQGGADEVSGKGSRNGYLRVCVGRTTSGTSGKNEWDSSGYGGGLWANAQARFQHDTVPCMQDSSELETVPCFILLVGQRIHNVYDEEEECDAGVETEKKVNRLNRDQWTARSQV